MTPFIYLNVCRAITVAARVRLLVIARLASAHMVAPRLPSGRSLCGRRPRAVVVGGMGLDVMATLAQRVAKGAAVVLASAVDGMVLRVLCRRQGVGAPQSAETSRVSRGNKC